MKSNGQQPAPFGQAVGVPIVGQPFTLLGIECPVSAKLRCNCGGAETDVAIVNSVAASCPSCHKVYNLAFNPTTLKIEIMMVVPNDPQVPS